MRQSIRDWVSAIKFYVICLVIGFVLQDFMMRICG